MGKYLKYFKDANSFAESIPTRPRISFIEDSDTIVLSDFSGKLYEDNKILKYEELSETLNYSYRLEDSKRKVLDNFSSMDYLELTTLIKENCLPYSAKIIGIYEESGIRFGEIDCSEILKEFSTRIYRFGLLSDVHNQNNKTAEPDEDLQRALSLFNNKEDVELTCICGDISENGTEEEFFQYKNNVELMSPDTPVYTCTRNHDSQGDGLSDSIWKENTGCDKNFVLEKNNDIFIFFSMSRWSLGSSGTPYSEETIYWLKDQLNLYRTKRVFIFTHLFFPTLAGNFKERYPSGNWLGGEELKKITQLRKHFSNTIWFGGHSHWKWYLQKYESNANIDRDGGWTVHVPSCASPIDSISTDGGNSWSRDSKPLESEGAIVDVYEKYIDIRGIDLKNNKYIPTAFYRLDTDIDTEIPEFTEFPGEKYPDIDEVRYIQLTDIVPNSEKYGSENIEVSSLEDNTLLIKFYDISTGLFIKNEEDYQDGESTSVKLWVDLVEFSYNGVDFSTNFPEKVGFYRAGGGYTLESCEGILDLNSNGQIQLNVSSSYSSDLPIYIKIRFKIAYK